MKTYVYKITTKDDLEYIGITVDLKKRISAHMRSDRFKKHDIDHVIILDCCDSYEEAGKLEEKYIMMYDTFHNGLNETVNGKGNHLSSKFTTFGYKFNDRSKQKMKQNHWSKTGSYSPVGRKHSEETKRKMSDERKGKCFGPRKISLEEERLIVDAYHNDDIVFSEEFIRSNVKKSHRDLVDKVNINELVTPNGKRLTKKILFCKYMSEKYNVTQQNIRRIIDASEITE